MEISTKKIYMKLSFKTQFKIEFFAVYQWSKMLRISPVVHMFVRSSLSFLKRGSLVFSVIVHDDSWS